MAEVTPKRLEQLRGQISESLFEKALKTSKRVNLITAHLNIIPDSDKFAGTADKVGSQQTAKAYTGILSSLEYTLYSETEHAVGYGSHVVKQNDLALLSGGPLEKAFATDSTRSKNIIFGWDNAALKGVSFRGIKGPNLVGEKASPIVPVKALARHFFSDLNQLAEDSKLESLVKTVTVASPEQVEASPSLKFLRESFGMFGKPVTKMNTAEQIEAVRNAIFLKAEAEGRTGELRQMLYYKGIKNLEGVKQSIFDPSDRFGVSHIFEKAIKPGSTGGYYGDAHLGEDMSPFLKKVEHFYGPEYAQKKLRPFLEEVYGSGGAKDVGVLLGEQGQLYIGKSGLHRTFVPLPAQVLEEESTAAGLQPGRLWFKNYRNSRSLVRSSEGTFKATPAIDSLLGVFKEGLFKSGAGLQAGTEETAFVHARNKVSKVIETIATSIQERGQASLLPTLSTSYSAFSPKTFQSVKDSLLDLIGSVGRHGDVRAASTAYKLSAQNLMIPQGVDAGILHATKAKEGIVPLEKLREFLIPGTSTDAEVVKTIAYQHRPREITSPETIRRIQESNDYFISKVTGRSSGSIGSVGMTEGEYKSLVNTEKEYAGVVGEAIGAKGSKVLAKYSMPIAFLSGYTKSQERSLFGDPAVELTKVGANVYQSISRPTAAFKVQMSLEQFHKTLTALSGGDLEAHPELKDVFERISRREKFMSSEGIKISADVFKNASDEVQDIFNKRLPRTGTALTLADASEFDSMVTLGFSSEGSPSAVSTTLGHKRITMIQGRPFKPTSDGRLAYRRPSNDMLSEVSISRFKGIEDIVGGITGKETLSGLNKGNLLFEHYTELSNYMPGGPEQFVNLYKEEAKKLGLTDDLVSIRKTVSGESKIVTESAKYKNKQDFIKEFHKVGRRALVRGGIPRGVVQGKARSWAKFIGKDPNKFKEDDFAFLTQVRERVAETADVMNQKHAFRVRMDMMRRWARGLEETTGIKPKDNPMFMSLVNWFEKQTGAKFSSEFLSEGTVDAGNVFSKKPMNIMGPAAAVLGESRVKETGLKVLTEQEALNLFVRGPHGISLSQETTTGEFLTSDLKKSALFNPKLRPEELKKGFFVKLNRAMPVPLRAKEQGIGKIVDNVEHIFVPAVETGYDRRMFGANLRLEDQMLQKLGPDSLERTLLGALSSLENKPGSKGVVKGTQGEWVSDYFRALAAFTTKGGKLYKKGLTSGRTPGSMMGRIIPSISDTSSILKQTKLTAADLTIGVSKKEIEEVIYGLDMSPKAKRKLYQKTVAQINKGDQYGLIHPYPVHTATQLTAVKLKLVKNVQDAGHMAEPKVMMSPFAMWLHHRDTDKDTIQAYIETSILNKNATPEANKKLFDKQLEMYEDLYAQFQHSLKGYADKGKTVNDFLKDVKTTNLTYKSLLSKMFGFGQTPPLAFAGQYTLTGLGGAISNVTKTGDEMANALNRLISHGNYLTSPFTGEEISATRSIIQKAGGQELSTLSRRTDLFYGNILQGFIQKGGKYYDDLIEFLASTTTDVRKSALKGGTMESSIELATKASESALRALHEGGKLQLAGGIVNEAKELGVDPIGLAAKQMGAFIGGTEHFKTIKLSEQGLTAIGASGLDVYRMATKAFQEEGNPTALGGSLESLTRFAYGEGIQDISTGPVSSAGVVKSSQDAIKDLNNATKEGAGAATESITKSEVVTKAAGWMKNNYKAVGIVVGGLIGLRMASELFSDDELKRPPLKSAKALAMRQAPLPPEPMVSQPRDDVNINTSPQRAYVQRPNGRFSFNKFEGSYSSVNNKDLAFSVNSMPVSPDYGSFSIQDSRSYQSNWELQQVADRYNNSDFLNPWGYS